MLFERVTVFGARRLADVDDDPAGLVGIARPMDLRAGGEGVALEHFEIIGHVVDGVVLDRGGGGAGGVELRPGGDGGGAFAPGVAGGALERDFELRVGQRLFDALVESSGFDGLAHALLLADGRARHARQDFGRVENADFRRPGD